jgi:hypothetical protein
MWRHILMGVNDFIWSGPELPQVSAQLSGQVATLLR